MAVLRVLIRKARSAPKKVRRLSRERQVRRRYPGVDWSDAQILGDVSIKGAGKLILGRGVQFGASHTTTINVGEGATLRIGDGCLLNGPSIVALADVSIGDRCLLADVWISTSNFHTADPARRWDHPKPRPITIGDNVWIARQAIVLPGVTIGDGSIVSAASVISEDVPARCVVTTHQQRIVRQL